MALRRLEPALYAIFAFAVAVVSVQLAYRFHPVAPLVLAGAAGATFIAVWRPLWTVYAAIALIPLEVVSLPVGQVGISPAEGLFLLTGICWATRRIAEGQAPWTPTPLGKPYALLLLAAVPGFAIVQDQFLVWKVVVMWTAFFFVFELIVTEGNERTVRGLLFALAVAGGIVGLVAISGAAAAGNEPELIGAGESATGRATGSFGHPNTLATFLGLALPGALAMGLTGRVSWRPVALAGFVAMLFALGLSLSRGGLLAVAGALGLMLLWAPFRRATLAGVAVVVFLYAAGAQPLGESRQVETVTQRIQTIETSAQGANPRFRIWDQAPTLTLDSLPFGFGANNFPEVAPRYGLLENFSPFDHAHNIPLTFLIERGIASLIALLWATVVLIQLLVRGYQRGGQTQKGLALAIGAAFTALVLQGMLDYTLRANVLVAVIFCLAACAVVLARGPNAPAPAESDQARPTAA